MRPLLLALIACCAVAAEPLRVVATVPELGAIARAVGGEDVAVVVLARPADDPHRVEARPSFTVELARADLLLSTGFGLEEDWLKPLRQNSGNPRIRDDQGGHLTAEKAVRRPIGVDVIPKDDGHGHGAGGHQHGDGNPHCLLDPAVGYLYAGQLAERLSAFRPEAAARFAARRQAFHAALATALAGAEVAARADGATLIDLDDRGALAAWLTQQGLQGRLGGWWGALAGSRDAVVASDHDLYPYLLRRFGLRTGMLIEPEPGVAPSARRLADLAEHLAEHGVRAILVSPYSDRRAVDLLAKQTRVPVVVLANQAGALPGSEEYVAWIDANVQALAKALAR